jgi:hypothetical protein
MDYACPDRLDVFHHTAATPLAHLRHIGDPDEGWYVIRESGCLVSVDGPFPTAEAALDAGVARMARRTSRRGPWLSSGLSGREGPEGHVAPPDSED